MVASWFPPIPPQGRSAPLGVARPKRKAAGSIKAIRKQPQELSERERQFHIRMLPHARKRPAQSQGDIKTRASDVRIGDKLLVWHYAFSFPYNLGHEFHRFLLMPGGKRPGAGRKSGAAWHGTRPKPIRDMARARVREVLTTKNDPLAILIDIANDAGVDVQVRVQAAHAAAPFMFPRLSASVVATAPATARDDGAGLVDRLMQRFARLAPPAPVIEVEPVEIEPLVADAAD